MNTGEMMLTMGAMVLLSLTVVTVNKAQLNTGTIMNESKFSVLAVSLGTSLMEEANSKSFDETTVESEVNTKDGFSATMGPESETFSSFDDCDDYNNYVRDIDSIPSADFRLKCFVNYVDPANPDVNLVNTKSWHKKITVLVSSPAMTDTIRMSTIFSYWYFR